MKGTQPDPRRKQELLEGLKAKGVWGAVADNVLNCVDLTTNVDDLLSVIELGFLPAKFGIVGIVLSPISNMIAIARARRSGYKLFEHKAISYTATAWAFDHKPCPPAPPSGNLRSARQWKGAAEEQQYAQAWTSMAQKVLQGLNRDQRIKGKSITPSAYKLLLRHMSQNDPEMLARSIWMSFESEFSSPQDRSQFKHYTEGILYPE